MGCQVLKVVRETLEGLGLKDCKGREELLAGQGYRGRRVNLAKEGFLVLMEGLENRGPRDYKDLLG